MDDALAKMEGRMGRTLEGHTDAVYSVDFSPDGSLVVSASEDGSLKFWDGDFGKGKGDDGSAGGGGRPCLGTLTGHEGPVYCVIFSPNGRYVASGSNDNTIKLWEITRGDGGVVEGTCVATLSGHTHYVMSVAFSGDGRYLASGSWDKTIKLWAITLGGGGGGGGGAEAAGGTVCATLSGHTSAVSNVAFSGDGRYLASGSADNTVKLWALTLGGGGGAAAAAAAAAGATCIATLEGHTSVVYSVAFSTDTTLLASGSADKTIRLWAMPPPGGPTGGPAAAPTCVATLAAHTGSVSSVVFHLSIPNILVSGSDDKTFKIWNTTTTTTKAAAAEVPCIKTLQTGHTYDVTSVAINPAHPTVLATGSNDDNSVKLWDVPGLLHLIPFFFIELDCTKLRAADVQAFHFVRFMMFLGAGIGTKYDEAQEDEVGVLLDPLPSEVWLHILSFLRLSELRFAV